MTTRVFLVRHGATVLTPEERFAGSTDVPLSDTGRDQASRLASRLSGEAIDAVYCSGLNRARDTAEILARPHRLALREERDLREISHGRWEGLTRAEVEGRFGGEYAAWEADPYGFAPPGGETGESVLARALPVLRRLVRENEGRCVIVVSHKAVIRLLLCNVLGMDRRWYRDRVDQQPACLNIIDFRSEDLARLVLLNDVSHYAGFPGRREPRDIPGSESAGRAP